MIRVGEDFRDLFFGINATPGGIDDSSPSNKNNHPVDDSLLKLRTLNKVL